MIEPDNHDHPAPAPPERVQEPRVAGAAQRVKDKTKATVKAGLIKLWSTGGGGFYGLGYLITFVWYEVQLLAREMAGADGIIDFLTEQLLERVLRLAIDSFGNSIKAFLWPVWVMSEYELWGMGALVVGSLLYARYLHQRIVAYLGVDPEAEKKAKRAAKKAAQQAKLKKRGASAARSSKQ